MFTCPECGESFSQKSNMKAHRMRKHTNEKPFKCPHCDHSCNDKGNLKRHIYSKHVANRTKEHQCPECGNGYYNQRDLTKHVGKNVCGENNRRNTGLIPDATIDAARETPMYDFTTNTLGLAQAEMMEAVQMSLMGQAVDPLAPAQDQYTVEVMAPAGPDGAGMENDDTAQMEQEPLGQLPLDADPYDDPWTMDEAFCDAPESGYEP